MNISKKSLFTLALFLTSTLGARDLTNYVRWDDVAGARVLLEKNPKLATTMFPCGYPLNWVRSAEMVDLLVEFGAKINAMSHARAPLHKALEEHHNEAARRLIELGADVEIHGTKSYLSPIHSAAGSGNLEGLKMLVEAGANVEVSKEGGWTPLLRAISKPSFDCVAYLVEHGAQVDAQRNNGMGTLETAFEEFNWAKGFLVNLNAHIMAREKNGGYVASLYEAKNETEKVRQSMERIINLLEEKMGRPLTDFSPEAPPSAPVATPTPEPTPPEPPSLKPSLTPPPPPNKSWSSYWPYAAAAAALVIAQRKGFFSWLRQKLSSTKPLTPQEQERLLNELNKLSDQLERQELSYDAHQKAQRKLLAHLSTQERTALMAAYAARQLEASKEVSW